MFVFLLALIDLQELRCLHQLYKFHKILYSLYKAENASYLMPKTPTDTSVKIVTLWHELPKPYGK